MSYCRDCVFCGKVSERQQEACGRCADPVEALKASVAADYTAACDKKMTRGDVLELARAHERLLRQRDSQRELLDVVQRVIAGALKEATVDATEV